MCLHNHIISLEISPQRSDSSLLRGKPTVIVAKTNKGRGVSFMEDNPGWHGKAPNEDEAKQAVSELGGEW